MSGPIVVVKRLAQAEGYLELGLPQLALEALGSECPEQKFEFVYRVLQGEAFRALARHAEALEVLERAVQLKPEESQVYYSLAWCYKRTGHLSRAIEAMRRAHSLQPRDALAQYNLACYLSLAGEVAEAIHWLGRALALEPQMRGQVSTETDFDPIRQVPAFGELLGESAPRPRPLPDDVA
jgi:tetratricopeptide (TPR) repeat protein